MGLELSGVKDDNLNWKASTKGGYRAMKHARTSFVGENKNNCTVNTSIHRNDVAVKENMGDASVSQSEKVDMSILGPHFGESLKSVPIKKRRFFVACSPPLSPCYQSEYSDGLLTKQMVSSQGTSAYEKHPKKRLTSHKQSSFNKSNDEAYFSGNSTLAAAACNSDIVGDIINVGGFNSKYHSSKEKVISSASEPDYLYDEKVQHMLIAENLDRKNSFPIETGSSGLSVEVVNGLPNNKSSVGVLQDSVDSVKSSSCNPRFHWDLNTVMDTWDYSHDEIVNCQPLATEQRVEDSLSERKLFLDICNSKVETDCVSEFKDHNVDAFGSSLDDCVSLKADIWKVHDMSNVRSSDSEEVNHCYVSCGHGNDEKEQHLDVDSVSLVASNEETTPVNAKSIYICRAENISPTDDAFNSKSDEVCKSVETEPTSILVYGDNASSHSANHKPYYNLAESIRDQESDENAVDNESTGKFIVESIPDDQCLIDSHFNLNSQIDRNLDLHNSDNINDHPSINYSGDMASKEPFDWNAHTNKNATHDISGGVVSYDDLVSARKHHTVESMREDSREICLSNTHCCDIIESSDNEILTSQTAHDSEHELRTVDEKAVDRRCAMFSAANLICTRSDYIDHNSLKGSFPISSGTVPLKVDADMVDYAVGSNVESKCYLSSYVNSCVAGGLKDNPSCNSERNSANHDTKQTNGVEKIPCLEDVDSHYEDGEFRESVLHGWEDVAEEQETEHLDYGSDNRENDFEPPSSVLPVCLLVDGTTYKTSDGEYLGEDMEFTISQSQLNCSSTSEGSDAECGKNSAGTTRVDHSGLNGRSKSQRFVEVVSASTSNVAGYISDDRDREASVSTRMKMSGWDQMPESNRHNREMVSDNSKYHSDCSFDPVAAGRSLRPSSSIRRVVSSRVKLPSSSDELRGFYVRESMSDDHNDLDVKVETDGRALNLSGQFGPSSHSQGRDRGERWFEPSTHCIRRNHDSSDCYVTPIFAQTGSGNAAAAAVAKIESNGFVVAPDGTLVKAGDVGAAGQLHRRSVNGPLHASHHSTSGRGSSFERNHTFGTWERIPRSIEMNSDNRFTDQRGRVGRYSHEMVRRRNHRLVPDGIHLDLLHLSRRDRSFSPHRGNPQPSSRSRSPFRSRSRSPHNWTSPKGRNRVRTNDGPVFHRRSRSPLTSNSDGRMKTTKSPFSRINYGDHMVAYGPRFHASLAHAPWDSKRDSSDHSREVDKHEYGTAATMRMLRNQRFNSMDSQGRLKPGDYYHPLPSRKVPSFSGVGRSGRYVIEQESPKTDVSCHI